MLERKLSKTLDAINIYSSFMHVFFFCNPFFLFVFAAVFIEFLSSIIHIMLNVFFVLSHAMKIFDVSRKHNCVSYDWVCLLRNVYLFILHLLWIVEKKKFIKKHMCVCRCVIRCKVFDILSVCCWFYLFILHYIWCRFLLGTLAEKERFVHLSFC